MEASADDEEDSCMMGVVVVGSWVMGGEGVGVRGVGTTNRLEGKFEDAADTNASMSRGSERWLMEDRHNRPYAPAFSCMRTPLRALQDEAASPMPRASSRDGTDQGEEREDEEEEDEDEATVAVAVAAAAAAGEEDEEEKATLDAEDEEKAPEEVEVAPLQDTWKRVFKDGDPKLIGRAALEILNV